MSHYQQMCRRGLETDAPFDPQNRIAQMDAATDSVLSANFIELRNNRHRTRRSVINPARNSTFETNRQAARRKIPINLSSWISSIRQVLPGIVCFLAANARAPHPFVDAVLLNLLRKREAPLREKRTFLCPAERQIPNRGHNFQLRRERSKHHIETHLIVTRASRPMSESADAEL